MKVDKASKEDRAVVLHPKGVSPGFFLFSTQVSRIVGRQLKWVSVKLIVFRLGSG